MSATLLTPQHQAQLVAYFKFIRKQRAQSLKELQLTFKEILDRSLALDPHQNSITYNHDDIQAIFRDLQETMDQTLKSELTLHSHLNVMLLSQYFAQCQDSGLELQGNFPELENANLLASAARFEETHFAAGSTESLSLPLTNKPPFMAGEDPEKVQLRLKIKSLEAEISESRRQSRTAGPLPSLGSAPLDTFTSPVKKDLFSIERDQRLQELTREREQLSQRVKELERDLNDRIDRSLPIQNLIKLMDRKNNLLAEYRERLGRFDASVLDDVLPET